MAEKRTCSDRIPSAITKKEEAKIRETLSFGKAPSKPLFPSLVSKPYTYVVFEGF